MFWKASVLEKTEGNKDFPFTAKLKVIPGKPSVLCYKKSKQKENRTEGNKGTLYWPQKKWRFYVDQISSHLWSAHYIFLQIFSTKLNVVIYIHST